MAKWNVHYGCRLVYDFEVEAETREEAIEKTRPDWEMTDIRDMEMVDDDVDAWVEK